MDTIEVVSFAGSAPFIAMLIGWALKPLLGEKLNDKTIPLVCLALSAAWGGALFAGGILEFDLISFIITTVTVATSASGMRSWTKLNS